jgi:beta-1,2-mannobiose phosphorylase / 1,2-beta-oligomannan phosphorylase
MTPLLRLRRLSGNPILIPTELPWENAAVCNPAALLHNGEVHLFYRAIDTGGISSVGHAVSRDGRTEWRRSGTPLLARDPRDPYQTLGVEDPRITWLEGRAHLTCTLASVYPDRDPKPWDAGTPWRVRVGLSVSEDLETFTPPRVVIPRRDSKNAVLFPERVGGRYVMFHRPYPDVWIAYSKDGYKWTGHKRVMRPRPGMWDGERVGAGPPPMWTEYGWLLMYHATEILPGEPKIRRYRVGLALFDREDPSRLIARSPEPVFEPEAGYEAPFRVGDWEIQVVFPTGWVEREGQVLVYYGAGDTMIGVATVGKDELLAYAASLQKQR